MRYGRPLFLLRGFWPQLCYVLWNNEAGFFMKRSLDSTWLLKQPSETVTWKVVRISKGL